MENSNVVHEELFMSKEIGKLAEAFSKAQGEFNKIAKEGEVDFTNKEGKRTKYAFATYQQMQDACLPALVNNGLSYTTLPQLNGSMVGMLMHSSGQWIKGQIHIEPTSGKYGTSPQDIGSAQTYMQKYLFKAAMCVPTDDDDGLRAANQVKEPPKEPKAKGISKDRMEEIGGIAKSKGWSKDDYVKLVKSMGTTSEKKLLDAIYAKETVPQDEWNDIHDSALGCGWHNEGIEKFVKEHPHLFINGLPLVTQKGEVSKLLASDNVKSCYLGA